MRLLSFLLIVFLFSFTVMASMDVSIDTEPEVGIGDIIVFDYTITSTEDVTVVYTAYVECPSAPQPIMAALSENLKANVPFSSTYEHIKVDNVDPQTCQAFVEIHSPNIGVERTEADVRISTMPQVDFEVKICSDSACHDVSKVFGVGEAVYLSVDPDISSLDTEVFLTRPDGSVETVSLPFSFVPQAEGTYEVKVTADKVGYRSKTVVESFGVLAKHATISDAGFSGQGIDKTSNDARPNSSNSSLTWIVVLVVIGALIVVGIFIIFYLLKRKRVSTL